MEEVVEVTSIGNLETVSRVREGLKCFEELHDFMRLCGVVEEKVTCHPRKDGRTQLDQLNVDCWRHIRHYLLVEDIKMSTQSADAVDSAVVSSAANDWLDKLFDEKFICLQEICKRGGTEQPVG